MCLLEWGMNTFLIAGTLCGSFATLIALFLWYTKHREGNDIWLTAQFSTNEIEGIPLNGDVKVFGALLPAPTGLLHGPLSGQACLWHRLQIVRHIEREVKRTDSEGNEYWETEHTQEVLSDESSTDYFLLQDSHGTARILPKGVELRGTVVSASQDYEDSNDGYQQLGNFLSKSGVKISGSTQNFLAGLDTITDLLDNKNSWITMTEIVLLADQTAVAFLQVGQDINDGSRFLYRSDDSERVSVLELAESLEAYEAGVKQDTRRYGKWTLGLGVFSIACGIGWFFVTHH